MRVEVIYAAAGVSPFLRALTLPDGATVADAIFASDIVAQCPEIDFASGYGTAIFGRTARPTTRLESGDRVEIVRPLQVDPKEARRLRAAKKRHRAPSAA